MVLQICSQIVSSFPFSLYLISNGQLNIQKTKILASSPITSWQIDGETVETVVDFIFLGSKITAAMKLKHACSWKESYNKPRQYTKSRDIILLTKVCIVKPMVFLVVTYKCESWIIKKAERQRTDAFQLWC